MEAMLQYVVAMVMVVMIATSSGCPSSCQCTWRSVTCLSPSAQTMQSITKEVPMDTRTLIVKGSIFGVLMSTDFSISTSRQIQELSIINGQLTTINDNAFQAMTSSLQTLRLNDNQISTISSDAFSGLANLQTLELARNKIRTFPAGSAIFSSLANLRTLDLQNNQISELPSGLFTYQRSLQKLMLNGNAIGALKFDTLKGLQNLRYLHASNCGISRVENGVFPSIGSVDTVDLSYNNLFQLPMNNEFQNLRALRNLSLASNKLASIEDNQLDGLNLDYLDLSKNIINNIGTSAFSFLRVKYIDLSSNNLRELPEMIFRKIATQLHSLKLGGNQQLSFLPLQIFRDMYMLQDLILSGCALEELQEEHFVSCQNLQHLDISYNKLRNLPQTLINRAMYMRHVRLENNLWKCDCNIRPLRNWLQSPRSSSIIYCTGTSLAQTTFNLNCPPPTCSSPPNLAGSQLTRLPDGELEPCVGSPEGSSVPVPIIIGVCAVLVVLAAVGLAIGCFLWRRHKRGEPLLKMCGENNNERRDSKKPKEDYYVEKKERRTIDPDIGSLNESDKSFVVRNYFHSMVPDPEVVSRGTPSMTRQGSFDSLSQSALGYDDTRRGGHSHNGSHYSNLSLNDGFKRESAV